MEELLVSIFKAFLENQPMPDSNLPIEANKALAVTNHIKSKLRIISDYASDQEMEYWYKTSIFLLENVVQKEFYSGIKKPKTYENVKYYKLKNIKMIGEIESKIRAFPDDVIIKSKQMGRTYSSLSERVIDGMKANIIENRSVFIVHGHDKLLKTQVAKLLSEQNVSHKILHEQVNSGRTIIEKFESNANKADYAIILMTPDDYGRAVKERRSKKRARQNVILELGYFFGKLGRKKVCILMKDNLEVPSDSLGIVYTKVDSEGAWKYKLASELKQSGFKIDLNKVK